MDFSCPSTDPIPKKDPTIITKMIYKSGSKGSKSDSIIWTLLVQPSTIDMSLLGPLKCLEFRESIKV